MISSDQGVYGPTYLEINSSKIYLEIMDTLEKRNQGLSGRAQIFENQGMLFIHEPPNYVQYWMKDMNFRIDILYLDEDFKILDIYNDLQPCLEEDCPLYKSNRKINYALELKAGLVDKFRLKDGDILNINLINK